MASRAPVITVIICARDAASHLKDSIPSIQAQKFSKGRFRLLVIDNGSRDNTAEIAESLGAEVLHYAKPGIARARQFAWKRARTPYVAFLDADCEAPPNWLSDTLRKIRGDEKIAAVGVKLLPGPQKTLAERHIVESAILDTDRFWERNALQFPFLVTAGILLRRKAIRDVGGFDVTFGRCTGEDADICWKLERKGWKLVYLPEIGVIHHHRATIRAMMRQAYWYGQSSSALFARWKDELGWRRYTDWAPYKRFFKGIIHFPGATIRKTEPYESVKPLLEALDAAAFLAGKWVGAIKNRVLFF